MELPPKTIYQFKNRQHQKTASFYQLQTLLQGQQQKHTVTVKKNERVNQVLIETNKKKFKRTNLYHLGTVKPWYWRL